MNGLMGKVHLFFKVYFHHIVCKKKKLNLGSAAASIAIIYSTS